MNYAEKMALLAEWKEQIDRANAGFDPFREALQATKESA